MELLVVMGIMMLLSGVLLFRSNAFGGTIILRSLAYDVALSIREAQTFGIAVRQSGSGSFGTGYGVEVRSASPANYLLYADTNADGYYSGANELVTRYTLKQGYRLNDLCYTAGSNAEVCGAQKIDITFKRPEPDAFIRADDAATLHQQARIELASPNGEGRVNIIIEATGQISVQ